MELAAMTLYKTVVMAVLALVGVFCYHQKMIDEELNKKLSDLVLMVFTPILLFTSSVSRCFHISGLPSGVNFPVMIADVQAYSGPANCDADSISSSAKAI